MKIFINAGHGGTDPGAVGQSGLKESEVCAKVAQILSDRLKLNYYPFVLYQQKNSYFEISKKENKSGATCFISIHCNSSIDKNANGIEVLYHKKSLKGRYIARIVQEELVKITGLKNRGIKPRDDLHVLNRTKAPAILIELAFISNLQEEKLLKENPYIFVEAIWEAIKKLNSLNLL